MQEQHPQNGLHAASAVNFVKIAIIMLAVFGLLDRFNIISLNKSRFGQAFTMIFATTFMAVAVRLLHEHVPDTVPPNAGFVAKLGLFSQQIAAIRAPKTIAEGAGKGLLGGALLALVLLKDKGSEFNFLLVTTFLGAMAGFKNAIDAYFRPRNP